jgi:hypothetical protein
MIHKAIYFSAVIFDILREDFRIGRFKHRLFKSQSVDDLGDHIGAPSLHVLGDALRLDHNHVRTGIDKTLRLRYPKNIVPT